MGYTTDFEGEFVLDKPLTEAHAAYLLLFCNTRRMKRNTIDAALRPDPVREAVGLSVGLEGGYFVGETGFSGQDNGKDVLNSNEPPCGQPGLWCQWIPTDDFNGIEWDSGEKFYDYIKWLEYIIEHFLKPWGYILNGEVEWQGEEPSDMGKIVVTDNVVKALDAIVEYGESPHAAIPTGDEVDDAEEIRTAIQQVMTFTERKRCPQYVKAAARKIANLVKT